MKKEELKKTKVKKKDIQQKIIVEKGRVLLGNPIEYSVIYTEKVPNVETAKQREKELKEEYKDTEGVSVHYFSL